MMSRRRELPGRRLSDLIDPQGRQVVKIESIPLLAGQTVRLVFEQVRSPRRQGIWLATEGSLRVSETSSSQLFLWADTAPPEVEIQCESSDGLLRFYNIWDAGRGRRSLSPTSGMALEDLGDGWLRYSCNDTGPDRDFTKLVFRILIA